MSFAVAIVGGEHITRIIPKGTHQYERFIKPSELCQWLRASGMNVEEITGHSLQPPGTYSPHRWSRQCELSHPRNQD